MSAGRSPLCREHIRTASGSCGAEVCAGHDRRHSVEDVFEAVGAHRVKGIAYEEHRRMEELSPLHGRGASIAVYMALIGGASLASGLYLAFGYVCQKV